MTAQRWCVCVLLWYIPFGLILLLPLVPFQKCLRFNPDAAIWVAKQQILCTLNESLKDVLNYGLFQPATNGRDAKFLDEERLLREYPQSFEKGVPYLEVTLPGQQHSLAKGHREGCCCNWAVLVVARQGESYCLTLFLS